MPTIIQCGSCATRLQAPDGAAAVKCPKCSAVVRVPGAGAGPAVTTPGPAAAPPKPAAPPPAAKKPAQSAPAAAKKPAAPPAPLKKPAASSPPLKKAAPGAARPPASDKPAVPAPKARAGGPVEKKPVKPARTEEADEAELEPLEEDVKEKRGSRVAPVRPGQDPFKGLGVPDKMRDGIEEQIEEGEDIVWVGRPVVEILLRKAKIGRIVGVVMFLIAVGVIVTGFVVSESVPLGVMLGIGGVLLLFSIPLILLPYLTLRFQHKRACYVVTNRRVIIYKSGWGGNKAYDRRQLMTKLERRDSRWLEGAGDLVFERTVTYSGNDTRGRAGGGGGPKKEVEEHGFMDVANVRDVENLIRNTIILRKPTRAEEKAEAEKAPAEARGKKPAGPAAKDDNIKSARSKASWLTDDEVAEVGLEPEPGGDDRGLIDDSDLPDKLKARVHNHLYDDETVFWVGRPHQKIVFMRSLLPAGVTLLIAGVMAFTLLFSGNANPDWWMYLVVAVLAVAGFLTPLYFRLRAHFTAYVLTSKRCVVFEPNAIGHTTVTPYMPDIVARMRRRNSWVLKGGGDLIFRTVTVIKTTKYVDRRGRNMGSETNVTQHHYGFMAIDGVGRVEKIINARLVEPYLDRVHGVE